MAIQPVHNAVLRLLAATSAVFFAGNLFGQNLLVHWTFDEAAGGTVNALDTGDAPATDGVLGSTATRTTDTPGGNSGFSVDLSAGSGTATSIVDGGNPLEVDTLAQFTLSTWVKVTSETDYNEGGSGNVRLIAKQSGGLFDGISWNMNLPQMGSTRSNNAFTTGLFIGGQTNFSFSYATEDILDRGGEWLFLAVTYDGNSTADNTSFYIGDENTAVTQLGATVSINAGPVFSTNTTNSGVADARFGIGFTDAAPTADTSLSGFQDDLRVYDAPLDLAALDLVRLANLPDDVGLAGDYSDNDIVDAADYAVWRDNLGAAAGTLPNDVDGGVIDQDQYNTWVANFGNTLGSGAGQVAAVPEPGALALGLLALAAISVGANSRRKS